MARPHIDFLHAQQLPWEQGAYASVPDVHSKTLSADDETGACTVIFRFPPGWSKTGPWHLKDDAEIYVLDGQAEINGETFTLDCYAFLPGGFVWDSISTETGVDILVFFEGAPNFITGAPSTPADMSLAVPFLNTHDMKWSTEGMDPDFYWWPMQAKFLHVDPATKACTLLVEQSAQHRPPENMGRTEAHPTVEEILVLSGEVRCPYGILSAGMYLYRPPGIRHGPYYSRFSNVMLVRLTGELDNNFSEPNTECTLYPEHDPRLPPSHERYRQAYKPELY